MSILSSIASTFISSYYSLTTRGRGLSCWGYRCLLY